MLFLSLPIAALLISNLSAIQNDDRIKNLPGYPDDAPPLTMYSGYIEVNKTAKGSLFYWFVESQEAPHDRSTPVVVWLNGGPGASSLYGLFAENGPFTLNDDMTLSHNPWSWSVPYHMLFVDNPVGTGFSFVDKGNWVQNEDQMGSQFVTFLNTFLQKKHSKYASNPLYITGESYAGRYIPFIAKWIYIQGNDLNLKGLAIGNGHYDPNIMFRRGPEYALLMGIIDEKQFHEIENTVDYCLGLVDTDCAKASDICLNVTNDIYSVIGGGIFQYNVLKLDANAMDEQQDILGKYLNQSKVAEAIHTKGVSTWSSLDGTTVPNPVFDALKCDVVYNNSAELVPLIIGNGTRILFYNGQLDGSVWGNRQNSLCLNQFNYKGTWTELPRYPFYTNYTGKMQVAGYVKQSVDRMLTYLVVSDSGHLVPADQPENSLAMIKTFVEDAKWH